MANISALQDITKIAKGKNALLVAISKTKSVDDIKVVYDAGQRVFGENKVQELVLKYELLPKDIQWHMVGNMQTNKVKYIAPFISLIHSVDSLKLAIEINKQALKNNRIIDILLEIHIAAETNKSGSFFDEVKATYFKYALEFKELSMGMSGDYVIALEEGSTMIRVGSAIFGEREIKKNPNVPI